jgi:hypothetical protein
MKAQCMRLCVQDFFMCKDLQCRVHVCLCMYAQTYVRVHACMHDFVYTYVRTVYVTQAVHTAIVCMHELTYASIMYAT